MLPRLITKTTKTKKRRRRRRKARNIDKKGEGEKKVRIIVIDKRDFGKKKKKNVGRKIISR